MFILAILDIILNICGIFHNLLGLIDKNKNNEEDWKIDNIKKID